MYTAENDYKKITPPEKATFPFDVVTVLVAVLKLINTL